MSKPEILIASYSFYSFFFWLKCIFFVFWLILRSPILKFLFPTTSLTQSFLCILQRLFKFKRFIFDEMVRFFSLKYSSVNSLKSGCYKSEIARWCESLKKKTSQEKSKTGSEVTIVIEFILSFNLQAPKRLPLRLLSVSPEPKRVIVELAQLDSHVEGVLSDSVGVCACRWSETGEGGGCVEVGSEAVVEKGLRSGALGGWRIRGGVWGGTCWWWC